MRLRIHNLAVAAFWLAAAGAGFAQTDALVTVDGAAPAGGFPVVRGQRAAAIYVAAENPETVRVAAAAFAADVAQVTGVRPRVLTSLAAPLPQELILVGVLGHSPEIDRLAATHTIDLRAVAGKWESALTTTVANPMPGVRSALVIAGSDRRGAAFALFTLSRQMGVSPWTWWADVPVPHHTAVAVSAGAHVQRSPSVQYRGIFLNDEDWGLRPWAAKKMDPTVDGGKGNIGPHTYERIFELLLRLHANSLWPAMHPGSLAFNAVPENAKLADRYGIVMGSSHSEALLRNNVGEWDEKRDGPWNYQVNAAAMNAYWDKRLAENGGFENFYTVGLRGVHDSGLEATGTPQVKAKLVEEVMTAQRGLLMKHGNADLAKAPQIIWLYKESLDLYRVGMKVPPDVTLGWTDDNYGYLRELPSAAEQARPGGSGVYYHVSYWGAPHDYLWLCTTPPALIQEEMTKAYDHNARRYWILNVGDLKPAEIDIDYFMQLAWDEPATAKLTQREFLTQWAAEQFPAAEASAIAEAMSRYYALNFIRKPEFMGFNGYNDEVKRTAFNPLAWDNPSLQDRQERFQHGQNGSRADAWVRLRSEVGILERTIPRAYGSAFFELIGYPIQAAAQMNEKFLLTDLTFLNFHIHNSEALSSATTRAQIAYETIQHLTEQYNSLEGGKWDGVMSSAPRGRHVFEMPRTATDGDANTPLPASWGAGEPASKPITSGFVEQHATISINAAHFARKHDGTWSQWNILPDLGISGASVVYGAPGLLANSDISTATSGPQDTAWLEYDFTTVTSGLATLSLHLLPTFAVDSNHHLRYAVSIDGQPPVEFDPSGASGHGPDTATWSDNVLRNSAITTMAMPSLRAGKHTLRLVYRDPGVVFEHVVVTFVGAPPAYPVPPETWSSRP